jgi:transposase
LRVLLTELRLEMQYLDRQIAESDKLILRIAGELEPCRRLVAIPGIGPVIATATIAAIGNGAAFRKGRGFAAWLWVVPGEHSTGGKQKLLGISKRGNSYLRKLLVQGARAVLKYREKQSPGLRTGWQSSRRAATTTWSEWRWPTNWHAWPRPCSPAESNTGPQCWSA